MGFTMGSLKVNPRPEKREQEPTGRPGRGGPQRSSLLIEASVALMKSLGVPGSRVQFFRSLRLGLSVLSSKC